MTDRRPHFQRSVFARLVAIMVSMAVCLILLVTFSFWMVLARSAHDLINREAFHYYLLGILLLVIVAVVIIAHAFLRHLLRPLRMLNDGVERLGEGELDVQLPRTTGDEFGRLTDGFNQMAGRVREMVVAREQMLIDVSHELRSPLTRMKVALELLPDNGQRARLARDVAEMEAMIAELLELERLRLHRGMRTNRQDLMVILREVIQRFEDRPPGVRLVSSPPELLADVDGEKVRTVLRNLLDNAFKYSLAESRPIEVTTTELPNAIVIRVSDDGVGIPGGDAERIFEPFYRVDRSRSKTTGGYGLGLSLCKRIMEAHGGKIELERSPGRGVAFVLTFPRT